MTTHTALIRDWLIAALVFLAIYAALWRFLG